MNPDTADYLNDREETVGFSREVRIVMTASGILGDPDLLNEGIGEYLNQHSGDAYFGVLSKVCTDPADETMFYELRGCLQSIAVWYAKRLIKTEEALDARHPLPKRQAD